MTKSVKSVTPQFKTGCGTMYVTVGADGSISPKLAKEKTCARAMLGAVAQLIKLCQKNGVDVAKIIRKVDGHKCQHSNPAAGVLSCPEALAAALAWKGEE